MKCGYNFVFKVARSMLRRNGILFTSHGHVVLENPPSMMMISPVTKRLLKIRLIIVSATSSGVQQLLSGV